AVLLGAGAAILGLNALPQSAQAADYSADNPLKVALVVHGNLGDKSFFDSAAAGMAVAEESLPVDVTIIEAGLDRGRWEPAFADAADSDFDVIIAGTWEMTGFMSDIAIDYPEKNFIIFDDAPDFSGGANANILAIQYRTSTAGYLAGYAAAKLSQTGVISTILGVEAPTVVEFEIGFAQGARDANPDIKVLRAIAGTFGDPAKGKELALAQIAQGSDVVFPIAGATGIGALQAARDEGKLAVGVDSDQAAIFAETDMAQAEVIFTSVEKKIGQSLVLALGQIIEGTAPMGSAVLLGLSDDAVAISRNAFFDKHVSAELSAELDAKAAAIQSGEIVVDTTMK
ncbi:MAG: BMP family ABC transporter substrate-binding protein, partial [Pseudomonadota bacterium]